MRPRPSLRRSGTKNPETALACPDLCGSGPTKVCKFVVPKDGSESGVTGTFNEILHVFSGKTATFLGFTKHLMIINNCEQDTHRAVDSGTALIILRADHRENRSSNYHQKGRSPLRQASRGSKRSLRCPATDPSHAGRGSRTSTLKCVPPPSQCWGRGTILSSRNTPRVDTTETHVHVGSRGPVYVRAYLYVCTDTRVYIPVYVPCTYVCGYVCTDTRVCTCTCTCGRTPLCVCPCVYVCVCARTPVCACPCTYVCGCVYGHPCAWVPVCARVWVPVCARVWVCVYGHPCVWGPPGTVV